MHVLQASELPLHVKIVTWNFENKSIHTQIVYNFGIKNVSMYAL